MLERLPCVVVLFLLVLLRRWRLLRAAEGHMAAVAVDGAGGVGARLLTVAVRTGRHGWNLLYRSVIIYAQIVTSQHCYSGFAYIGRTGVALSGSHVPGDRPLGLPFCAIRVLR